MFLAKLFREYDIRGIADTELTDPFVWALGRSIAQLLKSSNEKNVYVGQDVRLSSPRLTDTLVAGLEAEGIQVVKLKPGPTPSLYYAAHESKSEFPTTSGIMVTGSHNPPEFNGFKMVVKGMAIYGDGIQNLLPATEKFMAEAPKTFAVRAKSADFDSSYIQFLKGNIKIQKPETIKVVLDSGNGAGGPLGVESYRALGLDVIPLFCEFDGHFPNHHPDPTVPKNLEQLQKKVIETKAALGIAFDGDADRLGVVSATGQILYGDQIMIYLARDLLKEVPGAKIISEVKSSQVLYDELKRMGGEPIVWKTGHSLIKAKLKETGAELAGEMSGHIFFKNRFFGYDDALYAGARFIEAFSKNPTETIDQFLAGLPKVFNTPEIRSDCADDVKFPLVEKFVQMAKTKFGATNVLDIDGARVNFPGRGWALLRASNTQPVVVMRFEGTSAENLAFVKDQFDEILSQLEPRLKIPV